MGVDKLAGLYLTQQVLRITSNITSGHFITYDLALGVDNKSSPLRKTIRFDQTEKSLLMLWVGSASMG